MRKIFTFLLILSLSFSASAQLTCNPSGNLFVFSNYEGGVLYLNVDVNIPDIKIGVVTYESVIINLIGPFASNVTGVHYAGYGDTVDNSCNLNVGPVQINGQPLSATAAILINPSSTLANSFGSTTISCGSACQTTVSQGGCNTPDQIEHYMLQQFISSTLRSHLLDYSCWTNDTLSLSSGGTCCALQALGTDDEIQLTKSPHQVYPNPAQSQVTLDLQEGSELELINSEGRKVWEGSLPSGKQVLSLEAYPSGIYLLRHSSGHHSTRLIIEQR